MINSRAPCWLAEPGYSRDGFGLCGGLGRRGGWVSAPRPGLLPGENFVLGLKNTLASKDRFPLFRDLVLKRSGRTEGEQGVANPVLMYGHPKPCASILAGEPCGRNLETAVQSILGSRRKGGVQRTLRPDPQCSAPNA